LKQKNATSKKNRKIKRPARRAFLKGEIPKKGNNLEKYLV